MTRLRKRPDRAFADDSRPLARPAGANSLQASRSSAKTQTLERRDANCAARAHLLFTDMALPDHKSGRIHNHKPAG
jgi:hypothetical protein